MKTLILGSRGNLGSQLLKAFSKKHEATGWDREDVDLLNFNEVRKKILALRPEIIINTVAYNAVDKCEEDDEQFMLAKKLNRDAVSLLADIAIELDAVLVHYVSDYVFSGDNKKGYMEDAEPGPVSKYGETKLMGEREILKRVNNLKYYLIRTSKLF